MLQTAVMSTASDATTASEEEAPSKVPSVVGCFRTTSFISAGAFGSIWLGEDTRRGTPVAIKFESVEVHPPQLQFEINVYRSIQHMKPVLGFAKMLHHGTEQGYNFLVMTRLGKPLDTLLEEVLSTRPTGTLGHAGGLSFKTGLMLADQALQRLQTLHDKGFIHRDLKPGNFMMGHGPYAPVLHLIDFGMAKPYVDKAGNHIAMSDRNFIIGTTMFMSINIHHSRRLGRRDYLENLGYVLLFLMKGSLPWMGMDHMATLAKKEEIDLDTLCLGLPPFFRELMEHARALEFEARPNYKQLRRSIHTALAALGEAYDLQYDWTTTDR